MIQFNLSPSSIGLYNGSQLQFYFSYIAKLKPDTEVVSCYGDAGSICHTVLENMAKSINKKVDFDWQKNFDELWQKYNLDINVGFNGKPLSKGLYLQATELGVNKLLSFKGNKLKTEEMIEIDLIKNKNFLIKIKGIIDLQIEGDKFIIQDWKTSSAADTSPTDLVDENGVIYYKDFETAPQYAKQLLHYAYMIYKKYNKIADELIVEYIKIKKTKRYKFNIKQLKAYEKYLNSLAKEIMKKGDDIKKYNLGDIDTPFNMYKKACMVEKDRRNTKDIKIVIKDSTLLIFNLPEMMTKLLDKKYSYFVNGYQFSEKFKKRIWDGKKHLLRKKRINGNLVHYLGFGFLNDLKEFIREYNEFYNKKYNIIEKDLRELNNVHSNSLPDKLKGIELYDFQKDAVEKVLKEKIGILHCSVSAGKTEIAAEIIRKLDLKAIFLTHRVEILNQTYDRFVARGLNKNGLISKLTPENIDTNAMINIAMIQTVKSRLPDLKEYFKNIDIVIVDECHHLITSQTYKDVVNAIDSVYKIGLSGSIPKEKSSKLELKGVLGEIIYDINSTDLMHKNIISKPVVNLIKCEHNNYDKWQDAEIDGIINNKKRNQIIADICKKEQGLKVIIVKKIQHGNNLIKLIPNSKFIHGSLGKEEREQIMSDANTGKIDVLIGTVIGEGISIDRIRVLIIACGMGKSIIPTIQNAGRVMRKYVKDGKQIEKKLYDFYDLNNKYLYSHSKSREKVYNTYADVNIVEALK